MISLRFPFFRIYCQIKAANNPCTRYFITYYDLFNRITIGTAAAHAAIFPDQRKWEKPSVCRTYRQKEFFMRWFTLRIEIIRQYYVPGHTAYGKTFRRPPLCISHENYREWREKTEEPPPARAVLQQRLLNAYQAADYSQPCEIGRFFCFLGHYTRCRSPPNKITLIASHKICLERTLT